MDWKSLIMTIATIALGSNPKTAKIAQYVGPAIAATEDLIKKPANETPEQKDARNKRKLENAVTLVKVGIKSANAIKPGLVDENVSDKLIADAVTTVVDASNLIHQSPALQPGA